MRDDVACLFCVVHCGWWTIPPGISPPSSASFRGAGATEGMGRIYPRSFPREDVDFDSSAVYLCGEVSGRGNLSFSCGVINVLFHSTRKFMAISSNEAMMCQPPSHGSSPAMGAFALSKLFDMKYSLIERSTSTKKVFVLNESKQI